MRFPPHFRMSITRRGEKEQRLSAFIARSLVPAEQQGERQQGGRISVIARSLQSPVAKAIAGLAGEIAAAGYSVRMILAKADRFGLTDAWADPTTVALNCEARLARDPRLAEAHEQLVLGPQTCWTGDSMRRDPAVCDAYESFIDDCTELASAGALTFERLWIGAEPLFENRPIAPALSLAAAVTRQH